MVSFTCINGHIFPSDDYSVQTCPACGGKIVGVKEHNSQGMQQPGMPPFSPIPPNANGKTANQKSNNTWKIVASVIAALLLVAGIVFSIWFFMTKKTVLTGVRVILKQESRDVDYTKVWEVKDNMVIEARTYGEFKVELKPVPENASIEEVKWTVEDPDLIRISDSTISIIECEKYEKTGLIVTVVGGDQTFDCSFSFDVKHGGWNKVGNNWYFVKGSGEYLKNDWRVDGEKIRYLNEEGLLVSGWLQLTEEDGKDRAYYFDPKDDRNMLRSITTSEKVIDGTPGTEYTFDDDGHLVSSWLTIDDKTYYYDSDGVMVKGRTVEIDGKPCSFDTDGVLE